MFKDLVFDNQLKIRLPATYDLLKSSNLVINESVAAIILHGSRGLAGGARPDSDIDLSLIVDSVKSSKSDKEALLHLITQTTLSHWKSNIELDLAVVFDARNCGLKCFEQTAWYEHSCEKGGIDCFGLYKIQKGFQGLVVNAGVEVKRMYPCLKIWYR